jgi:RNA polymerase sigma factor for flagellar operon FliA
VKHETPQGGRRGAGVPAPLTREQEGWVERGMKVVARCARKHARRRGHRVLYEELLSLGSIGLMQAVRTYRPDSGKDFEIYCYKRVDGAMRYGMKKDGQFYALLWDAAYTHLETTRDEGPSLEEDGSGDEAALHGFSDRLLTAIARKLCGAATMMDAATSEEAVARRAEWSRRMRIFLEELDQTPEDGREVLRLVYDEELDLKAAGAKLGLNYGQVRRLNERTIDDLGARVRRRCSFEKVG